MTTTPTAIVAAFLLFISVEFVRAVQIAYFTTLRNDTESVIELCPDLRYSHARYSIAPSTSVTFLAGLSTVGFSIRTRRDTSYYKFPLSFGAPPTLQKGKPNHSYVFRQDQKVYAAAPDGAIARDVGRDFPIAAIKPNQAMQLTAGSRVPHISK